MKPPSIKGTSAQVRRPQPEGLTAFAGRYRRRSSSTMPPHRLLLAPAVSTRNRGQRRAPDLCRGSQGKAALYALVPRGPDDLRAVTSLVVRRGGFRSWRSVRLEHNLHAPVRCIAHDLEAIRPIRSCGRRHEKQCEDHGCFAHDDIVALNAVAESSHLQRTGSGGGEQDNEPCQRER